MPQKIVTAQEMRDLEKRLIQGQGTPSIVLMEQAAAGVVAELCRSGMLDKLTMVVCGTGNNGGDGLSVLRQLLMTGRRAGGILLGLPDRLKGDARLEWDLLERAGVEVICAPDQRALEAAWPAAEHADCLVDAIFGIGLSRPVEGLHRQAIEWMNASPAPVVAVDIPSGVDSDTGQIAGQAVRAAMTVTFQYPKWGQMLHPGKACTGKLIVHPIGLIPQSALADIQAECLLTEDVPRLLPPRPQDAHKGQFGRIGVIAGSPGMAGAGLMCARAALRAGAGLVTLCAEKELLPVYQSALPEAMFLPLLSSFDPARFGDFVAGCDAVAIGPGLGRSADVLAAVKAVLAQEGLAAVVDADGLNVLSAAEEMPEIRAHAVFTPHVGEMARLCGVSARNVADDPVLFARAAAKEWHVVVALKSAATVIAAPDGRITVNTTGTPAMAKGGTGDVLAGLTAALMGQGLSAYDAAALGSYLLGRAGEEAEKKRGAYGVLASDICDALCLVMRR